MLVVLKFHSLCVASIIADNFYNKLWSVYTDIFTDIESDVLVIWSYGPLIIFTPRPFPLKVLSANLDRQLNVINKHVMWIITGDKRCLCNNLIKRSAQAFLTRDIYFAGG